MPILVGLLSRSAAAEDVTFPAVQGWRLASAPVVYTPENLWDFIDGAAESYLAYSFVDVHVADYAGPNGHAVRAEVYRHADEVNAFGIYSTERAPEYRFLPIGAQGYEAEGILNFLKGKHYVKLSTHQKGEDAARGLTAIAGRIAEHLGGSSEFPPGVRMLPQEGKQPHSEGYVARSFLGYPFLHSAYTARYDQGTLLFVMEYPTADSAAAALGKLQAKAPGTTTDRHSLTDPNNGPIAVARTGALLYGAVGASDSSAQARYLTAIEGSIRKR